MPYTVKQQKKEYPNGKSKEKTSKAEATKQYFPTIMDRIGTKFNLTSKLTEVLSGHVKTKAYLHQFNLREDAKCVCNNGDQTMDHIIFQCVESRKQRDLIKLHLRTQKNWPANISELITKHRKVFSEYIESIDFDSLQ